MSERVCSPVACMSWTAWWHSLKRKPCPTHNPGPCSGGTGLEVTSFQQPPIRILLIPALSLLMLLFVFICVTSLNLKSVLLVQGTKMPILLKGAGITGKGKVRLKEQHFSITC